MPSTLTATYRVGEGDVKLNVSVGDAQVGTSTVALGTKTIAKGDPVNVVLGKGSEIKGKVVVCTTTVTDVRPETNHTSVTYTLEGGPAPKTFVMQEEVEPDGTILYLAVFSLA